MGGVGRDEVENQRMPGVEGLLHTKEFQVYPLGDGKTTRDVRRAAEVL